MRRRLIAALAVLALPIPASAAPNAMFQTLQRLCLDTRAEPAAVAKAAADWPVADTPPARCLNLYGGPFDKVVSRSHPTPGGDEYLLVSGTRREPFGLRRTCVLSGPLDAGVGPAVRTWTGGVKAAFSGGDITSYLILDTPTGWRAATPAEVKDPKNFDHLLSLVVAAMIDTTILNVSTYTP
ncbi:hypothetical protein [Caulobacter soli]|uniref:hypothetical protein n=1 Tax=Caulobacter soli TaxID=2708539 RepID=UPI0013EE1EC4|nr:hypothetical protein [Caulobacter soli]